MLPDVPSGLFFKPPVRSCWDLERFLPYLHDFLGVRTLLTYEKDVVFYLVFVEPGPSWQGLKHVVFMVLGRREASQGLPLGCFWSPACSCRGLDRFLPYLNGFRRVRALPAWCVCPPCLVLGTCLVPGWFGPGPFRGARGISSEECGRTWPVWRVLEGFEGPVFLGGERGKLQETSLASVEMDLF